MKIGVPRSLVVGIASLFSGYLVILALYAIEVPDNPVPIFVAMALFLTATAISLLPIAPSRMPVWMASLNLAVVVSICALVTSQVDLSRPGGIGYATWHIAAVGSLLTITSTRRRHGFAWFGVGFLIVQTAIWAGPAGVLSLGVIGSTSWVAVSHILSTALAKATRDAQRFSLAEREASDWHAAQDAHVYERQFRLGQTSAMALSMLRQIQDSGGDLTEEQRLECTHLESAIRDEIRGRRLLNDAVRAEVMSARRRGGTVTLLDEGGIDDLSDDDMERVLNRLALAIHESTADKVIARTVPEGSDVAITVVGLRSSGDPESVALGRDSGDEDEVELWLEIPRVQAVRTQDA